MGNARVMEWVDIRAPREEVFKLVLNLERRMQLSPLWGVAAIERISSDFPEEGSSYHVRLVTGDGPDYDAIITAYQPGRKLAYHLAIDRNTHVTWTLQEVAQGTRLTYEEEFQETESDGEEFVQSVRQVIHQWLQNIKRYSELRESRGRLLLKWALDRFYLKMRTDQRRLVQTILFMQAVGFISFVMAAIALGIASLI